MNRLAVSRALAFRLRSFLNVTFGCPECAEAQFPGLPRDKDLHRIENPERSAVTLTTIFRTGYRQIAERAGWVGYLPLSYFIAVEAWLNEIALDDSDVFLLLSLKQVLSLTQPYEVEGIVELAFLLDEIEFELSDCLCRTPL